MKIVREPREMQDLAETLRLEGRRLALVPTMGYLHEGHLSLCRRAKTLGDVVIVSLFVNPTQFGPGEDLDRYPRDFERDAEMCRNEGVDILFVPSSSDMYADSATTYVVEESLGRGLCGRSRPGHFRGVTTVVTMLFNIVRPHAAVFGEKDAQQLRILRRMVRDLHIPVAVESGPIIREPDGLAMSSRNKLLDPVERTQALCLRQALDRAEQLYAEGEREAAEIRSAMKAVIAKADRGDVDYIEVVDDETLEPVDRIVKPVLVAVAVRFSSTRLIDNTVLGR